MGSQRGLPAVFNGGQRVLAGLDLASYQGLPQWWRVKAAGYDIAIIKATQGLYYRNETLTPDRAGALGVQITPGYYHFAMPYSNPPALEAAHFVETVDAEGQLPQGTIVAVDAEDRPAADGSEDPYADYGAWYAAFMAAIRAHWRLLGLQFYIYSNRDYLVRHNLTIPALADCKIWLAAPDATEIPESPAPLAPCTIWQHDWHGAVPGIYGNVDLNWVYV